jgi:hypothetical protein
MSVERSDAYARMSASRITYRFSWASHSLSYRISRCDSHWSCFHYVARRGYSSRSLFGSPSVIKAPETRQEGQETSIHYHALGPRL